ncbi:hypothetical protein LQK93_03812 [Terrabacter sp. BE26]
MHACRLVDERENAEDVTAIAFLKLWRRRDDVRVVEGSVLPWLLVTTSYVARNVSRSRRRYRAVLQRLPREQSAPDPAEVLIRYDPTGWDPDLVAVLRRLERRDLQLVTLVILEGIPVVEAAPLVGVSVTAARSRLSRFRSRARGALELDLSADRQEASQ